MFSIFSNNNNNKSTKDGKTKQELQDAQILKQQQQAHLAELDRKKKQQLEPVNFDDIQVNNIYFIHFVDDLLVYDLPVYSCTQFTCYIKGEFEKTIVDANNSENTKQTIKYLLGTCGSNRLISLVSNGNTVKLFHNNSLHGFRKLGGEVRLNFQNKDELVEYLQTETIFKKLHSFDVIIITEYPKSIPQLGIVYPIFTPYEELVTHTLPRRRGGEEKRQISEKEKNLQKNINKQIYIQYMYIWQIQNGKKQQTKADSEEFQTSRQCLYTDIQSPSFHPHHV